MARLSPAARWLGALVLAGGALAAGPAGGASPGDLPVIVRVAVPSRLAAGAAGEVRVAYRAPRADVVAVVQTVEDLDGPVLRRTSRERAIDVVVQAFGREEGDLVLPLTFATAGRKRVTHVLVTDQREASDPAVSEVDVAP